MYQVDITADLNDEDETGYVWTFLDEARDPGQIAPGVLVVAGSADTFCPAEALAALGGTLPAATVTVIDGADHFFFTGMPRLRAALSAWAGTLARRTSAAGDRASPCRPTG